MTYIKIVHSGTIIISTDETINFMEFPTEEEADEYMREYLEN